MFGRNVWRVLIVGALVSITVINPVEAKVPNTHGPDFSVSFSPGGGAQVGQDVNIHVKVNSANPGATKINVECGGVSKGETSEVEFDSTWRTGDCGAGSTSVNICTKAPDDPNWQDPNCNNFGYSLSANNPPPPPPANPPSISCSVDSFDVSPNPATAGDTIHITGSGSCNTGVRAIKIKKDGVDYYEIGAPSLATTWGGASAGSHTLKLMVAGQGDNDWTSAASRTINLTVNDQNNPPPPSSTNCNITSVDYYPPFPQAPGVNVKINAAGRCDSGVRAWRVKVDGQIQYELGAGPTFTWTWNTSGWASGNHRVRIELAAKGDDDWSNIDADAFNYELASNASPPENPNDAFGNCEAISIGNPVFVIVQEGSAIQRRHVPNPETLDALGFSRQMINNKGFSDQALQTIGQGVDIPDVTKDPSGFATFKATFCPNLQPIVPGQSGSINQPSSALPGSEGVCSGWTTRLHPGDIAKVNGEGDGLKLRQSPTTDAHEIHEMPTGYQFQIIGGPRCSNGYTWWQISTPDGIGWTVEGNDKYWISKPTGSAPIPNALQPDTNGQSNQTEPPAQGRTLESPDISASQLGGGGYSCQSLPDNRNWFDKLMGVAPADAIEQCTDYVNRVDKAIRDCWGPRSFPRSGLWDNKAREYSKQCGWTVTNDFSQAMPGDVVVWNGADENNDKNCAQASSDGHVAVFDKNNNDGTFQGNGSNWNGDQSKMKIDPSCMSVIHIPSVRSTPPSKPSQQINKCEQYSWPKNWLCSLGWIK